jgi:flagellar hook-associated protein 2
VSTSSSAIFTGSSAYSQDFQNLITRAVSIASLPITQLQNDQTALTNQSQELTTLGSRFTAVQSAIEGIGQAIGSSFDTEISDPSVVTATTGDGAVEGTYSILVSDAGAYSTMMTGAWNAATGAAQTYHLSIAGHEYNVTPADNSAASVASAINAGYGDKVHATVVNVGASSTPDYRVSIQSVDLTSDFIDLSDGSGTSLEAQQNAGRPARYEINQSGITVSSASRTVQIADGVTLSLLTSSPDPVDVTVTRSVSALSDAITTFVTAYNATVDELTAQRGQNGGALQGQAIVTQLTQSLSGVATYSSGGAVSGLADLGLDLGRDGKFTFNSFALMGMDLTNSAGITSFFGSADGGGFLKAATDALNSVDDSTTGLIATTQSDLQSEITNLGNTISDKQTRVDDLQTQLTSQMSAADAAIATMEQQYSYLNSMFQAMQTASQQYR